MDAKQVLSRINNEDVIRLLSHLGSDISDRSNDEQLIFSTQACHEGEGFKLYYYPSSQSFFCYSHCGKIRDIFDLVKQSLDMTFEESLKYVIDFFGFNSKMARRGFPVRKETYVSHSLEEIQIESLPKIDKPFIYLAYPHLPVVQWLNDNISKEAMDVYNIRYSPKNDSAIIPHMNIEGEVVGVRVRAFKEEEIVNFGKYHPLYYNGKGYAHSLGKNLYGLNKTKDSIRKYKRVVVGESEKFCLQMETYFGDDNISVAICGSSFSKIHMKLLLNLGVEEIILALDKEYQDEEEQKMYANKIYKMIKILLDQDVKVSVIWDDIEGLLGYKSSPTDLGKETYLKLVKNRKSIREIIE